MMLWPLGSSNGGFVHGDCPRIGSESGLAVSWPKEAEKAVQTLTRTRTYAYEQIR